jgi:hypothetical protein
MMRSARPAPAPAADRARPDAPPERGRDQGLGFYQPLGEGQVVCALCAALDHRHTPGCPVITLQTQLRELTVQLGLFVATMRETLDALERLLRGDAGEAS